MDDFSQTGAYDALGSFSRSQTYINLFSASDGGLIPRGAQGEAFKELANIYQFKRCPGAAEAAAPDGSNVWSEEEREKFDCLESDRAVEPVRMRRAISIVVVLGAVAAAVVLTGAGEKSEGRTYRIQLRQRLRPRRGRRAAHRRRQGGRRQDLRADRHRAVQGRGRGRGDRAGLRLAARGRRVPDSQPVADRRVLRRLRARRLQDRSCPTAWCGSRTPSPRSRPT